MEETALRLMDRQHDTAVVLLSYRRPELTNKAAQRILSWEGLDRLYISIDGLRSEAGREEQNWWLETREVAGQLGNQSKRVVLNLREENTGLTRHVLQILDLAMSSYNNVILLEEDVEIDNQGLDFLRDALLTAEGAQAASAFTRSEHKGREMTGYRRTFFPELWGMSLNRAFYERFKEIWIKKDIDRERLRVSMQLALPNLSKRRLDHVLNWWIELFNSALTHPTHQDAVFALTALDLGVPWKSPWRSMVKDGAQGDIRSLNPRGPADYWVYTHAPRPQDNFCLSCETKHGRLKLSSLTRRIYVKVYRSIRTWS